MFKISIDVRSVFFHAGGPSLPPSPPHAAQDDTDRTRTDIVLTRDFSTLNDHDAAQMFDFFLSTEH